MNNVVTADNGNSEGPSSPLTMEQEIIKNISEISKNSRTTFFALIIACVYSYLAISTTRDAALLTNSGATPLPIIQVRVPIVWFYYFAPIILTVIFFYFHFYLERFWRSIIRLPLYHPKSKRALDDYVYPWLISCAFIRGGNPKLAQKRPLSRLVYALSLLLGWWFIPFILLFYWARYLVAHDLRGTSLHAGLLLLTVCFAFRFYYLAKNAVLAIPDNFESNDVKPPNELEILRFKSIQIITAVVSSLILGVTISYLSLSAIYGLPADKCRDREKEGACQFFIPGTEFLSWAGIRPFADISEEKLLAKPENWQDLLKNPEALHRYLETQSRLKLSERNLRHLYAESAFLPYSLFDKITFDHADLKHAVLTYSELKNVSFCDVDLQHTDFQYAEISNTKFENVYAYASRFNHTHFLPGKIGEKTLFSGGFYIGAWFESIRGDNLHFIKANLRETHFKSAEIGHSTFQHVDLGGASFEEAELMNNIFYDTDFTKVQIQKADLSYSQFKECKFISTAIKDTAFEDAEIIDSQFDRLEAFSAGSDSAQDPLQFNALRNTFYDIHGVGVKFINSQIKNTHFRDSDLLRAEFVNVTFLNTKFSDTDLSDATFKNTDFSGVEFEKVQFNAANLENVSGLTELHLQNMCGDEKTKLPKGFKEIKPCIKKQHL